MFDQGVDVSRWQTKVYWHTVREAGYKFAFVRALNALWEDVGFRSHWAMSKAAGLKRGAYLYYKNDQDGKRQARALVDLLSAVGDFGELPPMLDVESIGNPDLSPDNIRACLVELERLIGRVPGVYTRASVWDYEIGAVTWAGRYPLWVAHYMIDPWVADLPERSAELSPSIPVGWNRWDVWQISDKRPGAGLVVGTQTVDVNFVRDLDRLTGGGASVPPPSGGEAGTARVMVRGLNLRSRPRVGVDWVASLNEGEIVRFVSRFVVDPGVEEWGLIIRSDHRVGWAAIYHPALSGAVGLEVY